MTMARELSPEAREKIRQKALGHKRNVGRKCKRKTRQKIARANRGRACPEDLKKRMSKARVGIPLPPDILQKMKVQKSRVLKCPHCDKVGKAGGMQKHHMNNCKERKLSISKKIQINHSLNPCGV